MDALNLITKTISIILLCCFVCFTNSGQAQIDSGFVKIDGGVLFYRIWGEGPPLVFLNGGPNLPSNGYEVYATELAPYRKVILFDQRETGKSQLRRNPYIIHMTSMVKDLEKLRKHLKIEKWDVFGHSFGGEYAMAYTARYHEHVEKLILSATSSANSSHNSLNNLQHFITPDTSKMTIAELQLRQAYFEETFVKGNVGSEKARRFRGAMLARYYVQKPENIPIVMDWWLNKCKPGPYKIINKTGPTKISKSKQRRLRNFQNPVLIIHGMGDFINIENPLFNHRLFPNSTLEILYDSGHMLSIDSKIEYFRKVQEFLIGS